MLLDVKFCLFPDLMKGSRRNFLGASTQGGESSVRMYPEIVSTVVLAFLKFEPGLFQFSYEFACFHKYFLHQLHNIVKKNV